MLSLNYYLFWEDIIIFFSLENTKSTQTAPGTDFVETRANVDSSECISKLYAATEKVDKHPGQTEQQAKSMADLLKLEQSSEEKYTKLIASAGDFSIKYSFFLQESNLFFMTNNFSINYQLFWWLFSYQVISNWYKPREPVTLIYFSFDIDSRDCCW